jgi:exopolyphosphatase/guanosine-5'-triphosphate,3'-diphosphate pyrophosphatase
MKVLAEEDQKLVVKASVILRLARALNLGRSGAVQNAGIKVRGGMVHFTLQPRKRTGVDLEMWAIEKDRNYFREVFGRELSVAAA